MFELWTLCFDDVVLLLDELAESRRFPCGRRSHLLVAFVVHKELKSSFTNLAAELGGVQGLRVSTNFVGATRTPVKVLLP